MLLLNYYFAFKNINDDKNNQVGQQNFIRIYILELKLPYHQKCHVSSLPQHHSNMSKLETTQHTLPNNKKKHLSNYYLSIGTAGVCD